MTGPAKPATTQPGNLLPAPVPFSQAAVSMEQVFQTSADASEEEPPAEAAPPAAPRESARRTGMLTKPEVRGNAQVYVVGGISAAVSFILVLLAYLLLGTAKPRQKPQADSPPKAGTRTLEVPSLPAPPSKPELPSQPQTADRAEPKKDDPPVSLKQQPAGTAEDADRDFDALRVIPDSDLEKKMTALREFVAKYPDTILAARANSELRRLLDTLPIEPAKKELRNGTKGLLAEYFIGKSLENSIRKQVDWKVSLANRGSLPEGVPQENFSARWQGYLFVEKAGEYTIATISDDGVRVKLNGRSIISNWSDHGRYRDEKTLFLSPGYHELLIEYYQGSADRVLELRWALKDGFDDDLIPAENLFHEP